MLFEENFFAREGCRHPHLVLNVALAAVHDGHEAELEGQH
jgi:hypothetical protein